MEIVSHRDFGERRANCLIVNSGAGGIITNAVDMVWPVISLAAIFD